VLHSGRERSRGLRVELERRPDLRLSVEVSTLSSTWPSPGRARSRSQRNEWGAQLVVVHALQNPSGGEDLPSWRSRVDPGRSRGGGYSRTCAAQTNSTCKSWSSSRNPPRTHHYRHCPRRDARAHDPRHNGRAPPSPVGRTAVGGQAAAARAVPRCGGRYRLLRGIAAGAGSRASSPPRGLARPVPRL
jgi:hypothetical protein